jgi:hypothetical protein
MTSKVPRYYCIILKGEGVNVRCKGEYPYLKIVGLKRASTSPAKRELKGEWGKRGFIVRQLGAIARAYS